MSPEWRVRSLIVLLVVVDQLLKLTLPLKTLNRGASFMIQASSSLMLGATIFGLLVVWLWHRQRWHNPLAALSASFLLAGGFSNLLDRLFLGGVRDVLAWGSVETNVADILVILGLILLIGSVFPKTGRISFKNV